MATISNTALLLAVCTAVLGAGSTYLLMDDAPEILPTAAGTAPTNTNPTKVSHTKFVYEAGEGDQRYFFSDHGLSVAQNESVTLSVSLSEAPYTGEPWKVEIMRDDGSRGLNGYESIGVQRGVVSPATLTFHVDEPGVYHVVASQDPRFEGPRGTVAIDLRAQSR